MPGLLSLPNELLIEIFKASPTVQIAVRFSSVNKLLRTIWLDHADLIVEDVLKSTVPAAEEAIAFTLSETQLRTSPSSPGRPPLGLWLPNLVRNADLCASARAACAAYTSPKAPKRFPSSPTSYYFIRRAVLAFEFPELRDALHAELLGASKDAVDECLRFHWFLCRFASKEEVVRQGVPLSKRFPGPPHPGEDGNEFHEDGWSYAEDVFASWHDDYYNHGSKVLLPAAIQGYVTFNL